MLYTLEIETLYSAKQQIRSSEIDVMLRGFLHSLGYHSGHTPRRLLSVTHAVDSSGPNPIIIHEFLSDSSAIPSPESHITKKPRFLLTNALRQKHIGPMDKVAETFLKLQESLARDGFQPISPYVTLQQFDRSPEGEIRVETEVWVAINPNII